MSIIVAYGTRYGSTARTAELIARTMNETAGTGTARAMDALAVRARDIAEAGAFVVGSSIVAGRWKWRARRLLSRLGGSGKPVAVFVTAAGVLSGKEPGSDPAAEPTIPLDACVAKAVSLYVDPVVSKAGVVPAATGAFGGRMAMFGKVQVDNWAPEPVQAWARRILPALAKVAGSSPS